MKAKVIEWEADVIREEIGEYYCEFDESIKDAVLDLVYKTIEKMFQKSDMMLINSGGNVSVQIWGGRYNQDIIVLSSEKNIAEYLFEYIATFGTDDPDVDGDFLKDLIRKINRIADDAFGEGWEK